MAKLVYSAMTSLDGYVADVGGNFDWAAPDEEVHAYANDLEAAIGTHLYGRRMYETMRYWETADVADEPSVIREYANVWRAADKIVYSRTLSAVSSAKTRLERAFDPAAVRDMIASAEQDISVGGAHLAAHALQAGLVGECHLFVSPIVVGGGNHWLPDGLRLELELLDERRFRNGTIYLRYGVGEAVR